MRIRSLESPTNMTASSVPRGVIDRLRFLRLRLLLPVRIRLRNVSPKTNFQRNNRKRRTHAIEDPLLLLQRCFVFDNLLPRLLLHVIPGEIGTLFAYGRPSFPGLFINPFYSTSNAAMSLRDTDFDVILLSVTIKPLASILKAYLSRTSMLEHFGTRKYHDNESPSSKYSNKPNVIIMQRSFNYPR